MALAIKPMPKVAATKWDDEPTVVYIDGLDQDFTIDQALALAAIIKEKAELVLAGEYDHHYESDKGEEID